MSPVHFCTLVSNGSMNNFPDNTLTNFTNLFPFSLRATHNNTLFIRLRSIAISPVLRPGADEVASSVVEVYISELRGSIANTEYTQCLARFQFPPGQVLENYALKEFENTTFLPLLDSSINKLSVKIVDQSGQQLALADGEQPTLLHLEISEMSEPGHFNLTCLSHTDAEVARNPNNTLNNFTVTLPSPLTLTGYEAALASIAFPPDMGVRQEIITMEVVIQPGTHIEDIDIDTSECADDAALAAKIVHRINYINSDRVPLFGRVVDGRIQIAGVRDEKTCTINFSDEFMRVMPDLESRTITVRGKREVNLGKASLIGRAPSQVALLYCSCIEESLLGGHLHQLLHMLPVVNGQHMYEPQHLIYHPVTSRTMTDIQIRLAEPNGTIHKYESPGGHSIIVSLTFRPSQYATENEEITRDSRFSIGGGEGKIYSDESDDEDTLPFMSSY